MRRCERLSSTLLGAAMLACARAGACPKLVRRSRQAAVDRRLQHRGRRGRRRAHAVGADHRLWLRDSWGANTYATGIALRDFDFSSAGIGVGIRDRFELSFSRQMLDATDGALDGISVSQDVIGAKLRIFGDAVYAQDSWAPQVAIGVQAKRNRGIRDGARIGAPNLVSVVQLGARDEDDVDYYASATKIWLAQGLLVNATVRYTRANQFGLLGFGGDRNDDAAIRAEGTLAYLLRRKVAVGVEYRSRGQNLGSDDESAAWDAFVAWTPNRHVSIVAAYANLGSIAAPLTGESGDQTAPTCPRKWDSEGDRHDAAQANRVDCVRTADAVHVSARRGAAVLPDGRRGETQGRRGRAGRRHARGRAYQLRVRADRADEVQAPALHAVVRAGRRALHL